MNLPELLFFLLGLFLTVVVGRVLFHHIGWWTIIAAPVAGFGSVYALLILLHKLPPHGKAKENKTEPK